MTLFIPSFNSFTKKVISFSLGDFIQLIICLTGMAVITGVISGSYPAFMLSTFHPVKVLKGNLMLGSNRVLLRRVLVVFQFSISLILIICTAVIFRQFNFMQTKDIGFCKDNVVCFNISRNLVGRYDTFKAALLQHRDIISMTATGTSLGRNMDIMKST